MRLDERLGLESSTENRTGSQDSGNLPKTPFSGNYAKFAWIGLAGPSLSGIVLSLESTLYSHPVTHSPCFSSCTLSARIGLGFSRHGGFADRKDDRATHEQDSGR
jgi:hypothetical protein